MDVKACIVVLVHAWTTHAYISGCQHVLKATGTNAQLNFSSETNSSLPRRLSVWHENDFVIGHKLDLNIASATFNIRPQDTDRVIMYGDIKNSSVWDISITLVNISQEDGGLYKLQGEPEPTTFASFCLFVLDFPAVYFSDASNLNKGIFAMEGGHLILSGRPARILPYNRQYDVRMTWLLNDEFLLLGGTFTVNANSLIIWPVPATLHGANVTYQAMVAGHGVTTSVTTQLFVVSKSGVDIVLHPQQTLYVVDEGSSPPGIKCYVSSSLPTQVSWVRGKNVVANNSILSLGRVDRTMSGEYTCTAVVLATGFSKEKSLYVLVHEKFEKEPSVFNTIILTITGLVVIAIVAIVIAICRNNLRKRGTQTDNPNRENERLELAVYTGLQRETQDQRLYDTPDRHVSIEPVTLEPVGPSIVKGETRIYDDAFAGERA